MKKFKEWFDKAYKWILLGAILFTCWAIIVPKGRIVKIKIVVPDNTKEVQEELNTDIDYSNLN